MNILFMHSEEDIRKSGFCREEFVDFLFTNLERFRDSKNAINEALDYAFSNEKGKGGFLSAVIDENNIKGALLMIETGMKKYIPENILVYVAVAPSVRGMGIGKKLIEESIKHAKGNIALHVEYDNPAKRLYERLGFTSKYAEMRLER